MRFFDTSQRRAALALNETLRKENAKGALPDESGHVAYQIPEADFWALVKLPNGINPNGYDLMCSDKDHARKELLRLLRDRPEYKINRHEGRTRPVNRIIVK